MTSVYRPYEYILQDLTHIYIGAKFTLGDILEKEEAPTKLILFIRKYMLSLENKGEDTVIEDFLLDLEYESITYELFEKLKTKVKYSIPKDYFKDAGYENVTDTIENFVCNQELHEHRDQIFIEEICISKLALFGIV